MLEIDVCAYGRDWNQDLGGPGPTTKVACGRFYARRVRLTMLDWGLYASLVWYVRQTIIYFYVIRCDFLLVSSLNIGCEYTSATRRNLLSNHCTLCYMLAMGPLQHARLVVRVRNKRFDHTLSIIPWPFVLRYHTNSKHSAKIINGFVTSQKLQEMMPGGTKVLANSK